MCKTYRFAMHGRDASATEHHLNVCAPVSHERLSPTRADRTACQALQDLEALEADLTKMEAGARSFEAQLVSGLNSVQAAFEGRAPLAFRRGGRPVPAG